MVDVGKTVATFSIWEEMISILRTLGYLEDKQINIVRQIDNKEWEEIARAEEQLKMYSNNKQLFRMVDKNYSDLIVRLEEYKSIDSDEASIDSEEMEIMFQEVCRLLLNFLSMVRTYLDHWETKLKRVYGKNSKEVKRFKDKCSEAYDSRFSYRFLYKLRNYAQHCGVPIGKISAKLDIDSSSNKEIMKVEIYFKRDGLLNNFDSWGTVKEELTAMPESFEISKYIKEMMDCIKDINSGLLEIYKHDLIDTIQTLAKYIIGASGARTPIVVNAQNEAEYRAGKISIFPLSLHLVKPLATDLLSRGVTSIKVQKQL